MKNILVIGSSIGAGILIGIAISKIFSSSSPKLKGNAFTQYDNRLPVLNFEIDGKKIDYIDGGSGAGAIDDNIWSYTRFDRDYLVSAFNSKTRKASAIVLKRPANMGTEKTS